VVERLEVPVMFMAPPKSETAFITKAFPLVKTFRVAIFPWVWIVILVAFAVATFRVITLVVERFEVPVTFMVVPKREEALRVIAFVVERFEIPVTFRVAVEKVAAFKVVTLVVDKFESAATLRVVD